ncbi:MAG: histidine triad nucleotide-binding protein [Oscillospiraceae bacterium]|jgi:histidine triad (HIT) family protein|nr:histidine triad nucleotide-binding protein [Oscillospiraceae bacterium]MDY4192146.1 histidine triad nucleotide-binding protein [Oscillospiraceae bacterium]
MDCLFCKIASGEIPSNKIYEDDRVLAFYDIDPQAPVHFLVIPKVHIKCADEIDESNADIVAHVYTVIAKIAARLGLSKGYRIVNNCGEDGGQTVGHLHFHVLAGRNLSWPPG